MSQAVVVLLIDADDAIASANKLRDDIAEDGILTVLDVDGEEHELNATVLDVREPNALDLRAQVSHSPEQGLLPTTPQEAVLTEPVAEEPVAESEDDAEEEESEEQSA